MVMVWYDDGVVFERKRGKRAALRRHNTSKYIFIFHIVRASNPSSSNTTPSLHIHTRSTHQKFGPNIRDLCVHCVRAYVRATRRDEHSSLTDQKTIQFGNAFIAIFIHRLEYKVSRFLSFCK